ncbi:unnamed protein product, partial [marine sediment metagenome]
MVKNIRDLKLFDVPGFAVNVDNARDMIPFVKEAKNAGGIAVFMFHG